MGNKMIAAVTIAAAALTVYATPPAHADQATYDDLFYWVDWMADKYNMGTVYVDQAYMEEKTYGASYGRSITFNSRYVDEPERLHAKMSLDVAHGFHPGAKCSATQILAAHESAHVLDTITGYSARRELAYAVSNGLSGEVSGYSFGEGGSLDYGEALADAMVAHECDTPTPAEQALWEMLAYA